MLIVTEQGIHRVCTRGDVNLPDVPVWLERQTKLSYQSLFGSGIAGEPADKVSPHVEN